MRRTLTACALLASACSGRGEIIPTPSPAPDSPATTEAINTTALVAPPTTVAPTTTTEPEPVTVPVTQAPSTSLRVQTTTRAPATTASASSRSTSSTLASIRACESGGDYTTDTGNGYYGAYQFHPQTWRSVGGSGNPAHASPAEQDMRAQMMIDAGRRGEWPNC